MYTYNVYGADGSVVVRAEEEPAVGQWLGTVQADTISQARDLAVSLNAAQAYQEDFGHST